jgi:KipI family sensor histidine kinase inhibitor
MSGPFSIVTAGDSSVAVRFEERIDALVNARAVSLARALASEAPGGVRDVVPAFCSVTVYFDPLKTDVNKLMDRLQRLASRDASATPDRGAPIDIPVCYGGELGPDLQAVASFSRLTEQEVVRLHAAATYRVFMIGFTPGFPYMGIVDDHIAVPRRQTPRTRVPAGSVGIAGMQTGIYPSESPGGWQLIGRTPFKVFDPGRGTPFLLRAGDMVRFAPIDRTEFDAVAAGSASRH